MYTFTATPTGLRYSRVLEDLSCEVADLPLSPVGLEQLRTALYTALVNPIKFVTAKIPLEYAGSLNVFMDHHGSVSLVGMTGNRIEFFSLNDMKYREIVELYSVVEAASAATD